MMLVVKDQIKIKAGDQMKHYWACTVYLPEQYTKWSYSLKWLSDDENMVSVYDSSKRSLLTTW